MLNIENLNCGYGAVLAVHGVSFDMRAGSVFALLGPNGAGKTSTIMAIMGHVDIYAGRILLDRADITRRRAVERVAFGISLVRSAALFRFDRRREPDHWRLCSPGGERCRQP
jgi:branched-chain amino acid transport system ATP-binding protein